jgi:hypothetical protein
VRGELDLSVFDWVESQTSREDRLALLSIRTVLCDAIGGYQYLEIGSHLGGSLQPHVLDGRCHQIYSIDPRPWEQPDERWSTPYAYPDNSTERMLAHLSRIPGADLRKLKTFEVPSWEVSAGTIPPCVNFAFIDGEHTNPAVLRDFKAIREFLASPSIVAFHDCFVTPLALMRIRRGLRSERADGEFLHFRNSSVVAIAFAPPEQLVRLTKALLLLGWTTEIPVSRWTHARLKIRRVPWIHVPLRWAKSAMRNIPGMTRRAPPTD